MSILNPILNMDHGFACTTCGVVLDPKQLDQIEQSPKPLLVFCQHCCHVMLFKPGRVGIHDLIKEEAEVVRTTPRAWNLVQQAWKAFEPKAWG